MTRFTETQIDLAAETTEDEGYQAPEIQSAGSAVKLVQGHSFLSGYDWCEHGLYTC